MYSQIATVQSICRVCNVNQYIWFVTNGEWNSLRTKGNTRPLSVLQVRQDVRAKYSRMSRRKMTAMLSTVCKYMF